MISEKYNHDADDNQITRNMGGSSYILSYDAENRLVSVSLTKIVQPHINDAGKVAGAVTATFVYDRDGNRVKATISGTTTAYLGNPSESSGQVGKQCDHQ